MLASLPILSKGQTCHPPPDPAGSTPDCSSNLNFPNCLMTTSELSGGFYCDMPRPELVVVKVWANIIRKEDESGGQNIDKVTTYLETAVTEFAKIGILISVEGIDFIDDNDIYDFDDYHTSTPQLTTLISFQDHPGSIDIYFCGDGVWGGGKGTFPSDDAFDESFVVIGGGNDQFGRPLINFPGLLMHELGHVFGLYHTFQYCNNNEQMPGNPCYNVSTCSCGDRVVDTNYDPELNLLYVDEANCTMDPAGMQSAPFTNFMSSSPLNCRQLFTEGQRRRMKRYLTQCEKLLSVVDNNGPMNILAGTEVTIGGGGSLLNPATTGCYPGFVIEPGATLNIATDIAFDISAKILVKARGKLRVQGVALSCCNPDYEWGGIEVDGNPSINQLPASGQGRVIIENGSSLVTAYKPLEVHGGGLVTVTGTTFDNCGTSTFYNYGRTSYSSFANCDFINDESLPFGFSGNISLIGLRGLKLNGCTFTTNETNRPFALQAINSKFEVEGSSFTGYYRGIYASAVGILGAARGFSVKGSTFTDNFIGIEDWNMDNATIRDNTFTGIGGNTTSGAYANESPTGIILRNCTRFQVKGNDLTGVAGAKNAIGILAYDTGGDNNTLSNTFDALSTANQAELINKGATISAGLQYQCNTNTNNRYDFVVWDAGICQEQGNGNATKNTFSVGNQTNGDFNNQGGDVNYYHLDLPIETPDNYVNISTFIRTSTVVCSGGIGDDDKKLDSPDESTLRDLFDDKKSEYDIKKAQYDALPSNSAAAQALQREMGQLKYNMHEIADRIVRSELADSTGTDLPKIRTWLRKKDTKESEYGIVETWMQEGNTAKAIETLDSVLVRYALSGLALTEHSDYEAWLDLRIGFINTSKDLYSLSSTDILSVAATANTATGVAAAQAQALLNSVYGDDYHLAPKWAEPDTKKILAQPMASNSTTAQGSVVAFPNPANEVVNFHYQLDDQHGGAWLTIQDLNGRLVAKLALMEGSNNLEWNTSGLAAGVYYYKTSQIGGDVMPQKLILIK